VCEVRESVHPPLTRYSFFRLEPTLREVAYRVVERCSLSPVLDSCFVIGARSSDLRLIPTQVHLHSHAASTTTTKSAVRLRQVPRACGEAMMTCSPAGPWCGPSPWCCCAGSCCPTGAPHSAPSTCAASRRGSSSCAAAARAASAAAHRPWCRPQPLSSCLPSSPVSTRPFRSVRLWLCVRGYTQRNATHSCNTTVLHDQPPRCTTVSYTSHLPHHPPKHLPHTRP
jgi:hypothetical protein